MSVLASAMVWKLSRQTLASHLLMMMALADFADDELRCYPSNAALARKCRMTPRHANRVIAALVESGELQIRHNAGPHGCNRYRLLLQEGLTRKSPPDAQDIPDPQDTPDAPVTLTPRSATPDAQVLNPLTSRSDEPSLNRQEPSPRARKRAASREAEHPLFEQFYAAYPRKVARDRAAKAFAKLDPRQDVVEAMLKAIRTQRLAEKCASGEERFVPHPATWLNDGRWKDETSQAPLGLVGGSNGEVAL